MQRLAVCITKYLYFVFYCLNIEKYDDREFIEPVETGGAAAHVWKGKWKSRNMTVAIKKVMDLPEDGVSL